MKITSYIKLLPFVFVIAFFSCSGSEEEPQGTPNNPSEMMEQELDDAPDFSLETTTGAAIDASQFDDKNLVIFFFGYGCPPCRGIGADVESKLHQAFKDNSEFAIIGADQWQGNNAGVDDFAEFTGITFPLGTKGAAMARDFGTTYDRLVVVNKEGKIIYRGNSIVKNNLDEVVEIVSDLLN